MTSGRRVGPGMGAWAGKGRQGRTPETGTARDVSSQGIDIGLFTVTSVPE